MVIIRFYIHLQKLSNFYSEVIFLSEMEIKVQLVIKYDNSSNTIKMSQINKVTNNNYNIITGVIYLFVVGKYRDKHVHKVQFEVQ